MSLADLTPAEELAQAIPLDLATEFIKHRKALKKPMTAFAARLMAKKLKTFADPIAAVEKSILSGWTDVYQPDGQRNGRPVQPATPTFDDLADFYDAQARRESGDSSGTLPLLPHLSKH